MSVLPTVQQTFAGRQVWEPLYRLRLQADALEAELFQSAPLRRLKHLRQFGAGALFSPVTHSRYEHTVGVWALVKTFFPEHRELCAAAIVHDLGHLPFSHTVETALGISHHGRTEEIVRSPAIANILYKHGLSPSAIVSLLNGDSPLTHRTGGMGIDHLDSFLRDTYAVGCYAKAPAELITRIRFRGNQVEADEETALHLLHAVVNDNRIFLHPSFLAMDALLSKAVLTWAEERPELRDTVPDLVDFELLSLLLRTGSSKVRSLLHVLLYEPHRIVACEEPVDRPDACKAEVRKVYNKQPLVGGEPIASVNAEAEALLQELENIRGTYYWYIKENGGSMDEEGE